MLFCLLRDGTSSNGGTIVFLVDLFPLKLPGLLFGRFFEFDISTNGPAEPLTKTDWFVLVLWTGIS